MMMAIRTRWLPVLIAGVAALSLGLMAANAAPARAASEDLCIAFHDDADCSGVQVYEGDVCFLNSQILDSRSYVDAGWSFEIDLRYSPQCHSNFSVTHAYGGPFPYEYSGKVRRYAGPDGPYLMEHADWTWGEGPYHPDVLSPLVYAPRNLAQACFSSRANDQFPCTGLH